MSFLTISLLCYIVPALITWCMLLLIWKTSFYRIDTDDFRMITGFSLIPVANIFSSTILIAITVWFSIKPKNKYDNYLK